MDYELFVVRVGQRADVGREDVEVLIRATLLTLSERISGREARDLAENLPEELRAPLADAEEIAESFQLDEFVRRVADRADGDLETAAACSRAVMITLRETVPRSDFDDVTAQLPKNFIDLMGAVSER
ncbi:DUF2267 domain-containing protein [Leifsonia sp. NPDC058230]|uniref:DUF2267 domain-containing protein n=1 Tax=Leifsonia sp. NPDC058230 TaxID=3346391 RepID=UPI0036D79C85